MSDCLKFFIFNRNSSAIFTHDTVSCSLTGPDIIYKIKQLCGIIFKKILYPRYSPYNSLIVKIYFFLLKLLPLKTFLAVNY